MFPNPMQLCAHGMSLAQTGWAFEGMGNPGGAGQAYAQAVQALNAARAQAGGFLPDQALYCLGCCQVRLGWLSHVGGNPGWAEQWLRQALPELEAAWRACPANPAYQSMLGNTALLLGRNDIAEAVARSLPGAVLRPVAQGQPSTSSKTDWLKLLKQGVAAAKGCKQLLDALGQLSGGGHGSGWGQGFDATGGMPWGGSLGMDASATGWWG